MHVCHTKESCLLAFRGISTSIAGGHLAIIHARHTNDIPLGTAEALALMGNVVFGVSDENATAAAGKKKSRGRGGGAGNRLEPV